MFGLGFGEMIVLGVVLLVVVGPRELPKLLRSLGRAINKLRRMSTDLRQQSGIDDIIHEEGLRDELDAIRSLSKGRLLNGAMGAASRPAARRPPPSTQARSLNTAADALTPPVDGEPPNRDNEYPRVGCDAYGALADDELAPLPIEPAATEATATVAPDEEDISGASEEVLDGFGNTGLGDTGLGDTGLGDTGLTDAEFGADFGQPDFAKGKSASDTGSTEEPK